MATNLHRIWQNFVWRIESATPQCSRGTIAGGFCHLNGRPPTVSAARGFEVRRVRRESPDGTTSQYQRIGDHVFEVEVYYGSLLPDAIAEVADQDAHTLIAALRASSSWVGYDADHTTDDIGLKARWEAGDEVVRLGQITALRLRFRVKALETEG